MEEEIDLLINMAGWFSVEEWRKIEFFHPFVHQDLSLCPSVWSVDFTSPLIFT